MWTNPHFSYNTIEKYFLSHNKIVMLNKIITLNEYITQKQKDFSYATGELSALLQDIALAAKIVNREVNKAGLVNILGATGDSNVYGEQVKKLDIFANDQFIRSLRTSGECCGVASEEEESFIAFENEQAKNAHYVVCMDPLDGSSNIDVNISIGTIFGIYRRVSPVSEKCSLDDFLQKGRELVAAGYVIYGSSTMLVYSAGEKVNGFTLDPSLGEFCLSHHDIKIPKKGKIYSVNESYKYSFSKSVNAFIEYCKEEDKATNRPYSSRYVGSMVTDFHRNLIKGGIFMYPAMRNHPNGKLRLLYEGCPMAYLVEKAGGRATTGYADILDVQPTDVHQRVPIFIGSEDMVEKIESFIQKYESVSSL